MLQELHIQNYALIDELHINYHNGLNIITGETGAGKSIILGALGLIMGQRADLNALRDETKKCVVEAIFDIQNLGINDLFEQEDLDVEQQTILRREISPKGKSRAFINDTPVNLSVMKDVAERLIDIHSQHQNLILNNRNFQLSLVDLVAQNSSLLNQYQQSFESYSTHQLELDKLKREAEQTKGDLDYLEFQLKQLSDAQLIEGEQEKLEEEQLTLDNAEEIKVVFSKFSNELEQDEQGILVRLKSHLNQLQQISAKITSANELAERLNSVYIDMKDLASECSQLAEDIEYDPARLSYISERLDNIYSLHQKFATETIEELIEKRNEFEQKVNTISSFDEEIEVLQNKVDEHRNKAIELAKELSEKRKLVASNIAEAIIETLHKLGMPNAIFELQFNELDKLSSLGIDNISFLFASNKGSSLQDVSKVASGGEISRVMLAIKSLVALKKALPTIIFDEIDTGISGEVAIKMGDIIKALSSNVQILNITHLPQIAGKGNHHYKVYKLDNNNSTYTSIKKLSEQERIEELALMLGGSNPTKATIQAARELLDRS